MRVFGRSVIQVPSRYLRGAVYDVPPAVCVRRLVGRDASRTCRGLSPPHGQFGLKGVALEGRLIDGMIDGLIFSWWYRFSL